MVWVSSDPVEYVPHLEFLGWKQIDFHRTLLSDKVRTAALIQAIERAVRPSHCVVDLGSGSGILGMAAKRAGAAHVYSIDKDNELAKFARQNARANGLEITQFSGCSHEVEMPRPVDLLVSECMGPIASSCTFMLEGVLA